MIVGTRFGNRKIETRAPGEWGTEHLIPSPDGYSALTTDAAVGLPAVGAAIRLISWTIAGCGLCVWQGDGAQKKKRDETWQYDLFEFPNDEVSAFSFLADIASGIEGYGNAYIFKAKMPASGRVGALKTLHPANMTVRRDTNTRELIYEWWDGRKTLRIPPENVIHVRGDNFGGGDVGYSPLAIHRQALQTSMNRQTFEGQHFASGAIPGVILKFPNDISREKARGYADEWDRIHMGAGKAGRTAVVGGGVDVATLPISLEDAQFVENQKFSINEVARMFNIPATLLEEGDFRTSEEESLRFLKFGLYPRLKRIEEALLADPDLFGPDQPLYPEFDIDEFVRADAKTTAQVAKEKVQSGIWLVDEARAMEGLPPLPDGAGQIPQIVPVGGQANPAANPPEE